MTLLALSVVLAGCDKMLEDVGDFFVTLFRIMYIALAVAGLGGIAFNVWRVLGNRRTFYPLLFAVPLFLGDACVTFVAVERKLVLGPTARLAMWCLCVPVAFLVSSVLLPWAAPGQTPPPVQGYPPQPGAVAPGSLPPRVQRIAVVALASLLAVGYAVWTFAFVYARQAPPIETISRMRVTRERGCALHDGGELGCWEPYLSLSTNAANFDVSGEFICWIDRGGPVKCHRFATTSGKSTWDVIVRDALDVSIYSPYGCAIDRARAAHCWALFGSGPSHLKPAVVEGLDAAVQIAVHYDRGCALEQSGRVACWNMPKHDATPAAPSARAPAAVSASGTATTSSTASRPSATSSAKAPLATPPAGNSSAGPPATSGAPAPEKSPNRAGELRLVATTVPELEPASGIGVGQDHACALLRDGRVKCWGTSNQFGVLGPAVTSTAVPVAIASLTNVTQLAVGLSHNCALKRDGTVWCWGSRDNGLMGDGETSGGTNATTPVAVALPGKASVLHISDNATCARIGDDLYCWGTNDKKELSVELREDCGGSLSVDFCTPRPSLMRWP